MTLKGAFNRPFRFQVAAFRLRLRELAPTARWDDLWQESHDRAFMVAGAMKADLLADLAAAVDKAISQGTSLEEFRRDFRKIVTDRGWHGWTGEGTKKGEAWRTRVIYRTNMATSYAAGRWAQLREAGYPLIVYHHGNSLEPRPHHLAWDGLILEAGHPFWATHAPPNGWGCSCYVSGARTMDQARRLGGKPGKELEPGWAARDPRTGAPKGIDKGWAYAPGASVAETIAQLAAKAAALPAPLGADLATSTGPAVASGPAAPTLNWRDWPEAATVEEAARAALAAGVAAQISLRRTLPAAGVSIFLRTGAEIAQRFRLPPLAHFATKDDLPFTVRASRRAPAFYVPARRAIGIAARAVNVKQMREGFDVPEPPLYLARWRNALAAAAPDVAAIGARMATRRWAVVADVRGVAAHEWGHHLHYVLAQEIDDLIRRHRMIQDGWPLLISRYAEVDRHEFIAESFALYMTGDEAQFFRLHPALLAWFRQREGLIP